MNWAFFLDIDGTLIDIAPTPDQVVVPAALPALLESLAGRLDGALALVSGRSLDDIDRLFPGGRDAAGSHGAECRLGGTVSALAGEWPAHLARTVEERASRLPGVLVEHKKVSVALHFRAAPEHAGAVRALAEDVVRDSPMPLRVQDGKMVVELVPAGMTKGNAIQYFLRNGAYAGKRPVFVGDDKTDESGFVAVNNLGGVSIHVGDSATTAARFRFSSPASLRHWLASLETSLGGIAP